MDNLPQDLAPMADAEFDPNADRLREECGVFGIFGHPDAAAITALGLHALQHRGQEAAGIVSFDGKLTNGIKLRRDLVHEGAMMQSTTDTEMILHLVARARRNRFIDRFIEGLRQLEGSYSLTALTNKKLIGARDPF